MKRFTVRDNITHIETHYSTFSWSIAYILVFILGYVTALIIKTI